MKKEIMDCQPPYGNGTKYRLVFNDQEYYLANVWRNPLVNVFPFLIWFVPQTLYKITEEERDQLFQEEKRAKPQVGKTGITIGLSLGVTALLRKITSDLGLDHSGVSLQVTLIIMGIQILLMIYLIIFFKTRKNGNISLINRIFQEKKGKKKVMLIPTFKRSGLNASPLAFILVWLFLATFGILVFYIIIIAKDNTILLLMFPVFLFLMLVLPYAGFLSGKHYVIFK